MQVTKKVLELENEMIEVRENIDVLSLKIQANPYPQLKQELEREQKHLKELELDSVSLVPLIEKENELVNLEKELNTLMSAINVKGEKGVLWSVVYGQRDAIQVLKHEVNEGLKKIN